MNRTLGLVISITEFKVFYFEISLNPPITCLAVAIGIYCRRIVFNSGSFLHQITFLLSILPLGFLIDFIGLQRSINFFRNGCKQ